MRVRFMHSWAGQVRAGQQQRGRRGVVAVSGAVYILIDSSLYLFLFCSWKQGGRE